MNIPQRSLRLRSSAARAFTLVELLTVMTIIGVLAALVLGTFKFVQEKGARSRAEAEIKAMEAALESFKADNGSYPDNSSTQNLNAQSSGNPSLYAAQSLILYRALSGDTNLDRKVDNNDMNRDIYGAATTSNVVPKVYFEFKPTQLVPLPPSTSNVTGLADPWGTYYGYSTAGTLGSASAGYNPTFDLWSTGGKTTTGTDDVAKWLKNW